MTEKEYRLLHFEERLGWIKGKRVYIYGTGNNARAVLERFQEAYSFSGVIAPDAGSAEGFPECPGTPLISLQEAFSRGADIILIASQMFAEEEIYGRIGDACRANGVLLLDLYGTDLISLHDELEAQPFMDLEGWKRKTSGYDVISLELLDMVLARDILNKRAPVVRPVFAHLIPYLKAAGKKLIYIAAPELPPEWYREAMEAAGLADPEDEVYFFNDTERFFRDIKDSYPGKSILNISCRVLSGCIIPRICGLDSCRYVFADAGVLTGFEKAEGGALLPEKEGFIRAIDRADTIFFDLFDTLVCRAVSCPEDVFALTAYRSGKMLGTDGEREDYYRLRCALQNAERKTEALPGTDPSVSEKLLLLELDCEADVLDARKGVKELLEYAVSAGKKTAVVSDTDRGSTELRRLMAGCGIKYEGRIFASCEYGLSKKDGLLGIALKECGSRPETALLLGDSNENDCRPAERAGMRFMKVPSAAELSEAAGAALPSAPGALPGRSELAERVLMGLWAQSCFGDLFLPEGRNELLKRYGAAAVAPAVIAWDLWLLERAKAHGAEGILFTARDGWLPLGIYEKLGLMKHMAGRYFYTSRRAAFLLSSAAKESAGYIASMAEGMDPREVLGRFYGIEESAAAADPDKRSMEDLKKAILENSGAAEEASEKALRAAKEYWKKTGLKPGKTYIYADFVASGTSQRLLEEAVPFALKGCYFGRPVSGFAQTGKAESMLKGNEGPERALLERYMEMEYYMTSPEPSLVRFDGEGCPLFAEEIRTEDELSETALVHKSAMKLTERFMKLSMWNEFKAEDTEGLSGAVCPEKLASMALAGSIAAPERRYYDDWSGRWLND